MQYFLKNTLGTKAFRREKGMIFYFSGTGNSKGIAEITAKHLGTEAIDIIGRNPEEFHLEGEEYLGFVFPIYAWAAPEVMLNFVKGIEAKEAYTFAIATFSNVAGLALEQFSEIVPLKSGFGIVMPDNYPITERILDTKESSMDKLADAQIRLDMVLEKLSRKEEGFDVKIGEDAWDNTYVKSHIFNAEWRKTAAYHVEEECMGCGLCEKICPAEAIEIQEGRPVWVKDDCYLCMACLNRCPVEAINYGPHSKGRYRYYFKGFSSENYK